MRLSGIVCRFLTVSASLSRNINMTFSGVTGMSIENIAQRLKPIIELFDTQGNGETASRLTEIVDRLFERIDEIGNDSRVAANGFYRFYKEIKNANILGNEGKAATAFNEVLNEMAGLSTKGQSSYISQMALNIKNDIARTDKAVTYEAADALKQAHLDDSFSNKNANSGGHAANFSKMREQLANMQSGIKDTVNNANDAAVIAQGANPLQETVLAASGQSATMLSGMDRTVVAEAARAAIYMDGEAYSAAAGRSGISLREYCSGLAQAYESCGGDTSSEQYLFLKSVSENSYYDRFKVDKVYTSETQDNSLQLLSITDGAGHAVISIGTNETCGQEAAYTAFDRALAEEVSAVCGDYTTFELCGVGEGGNAAVVAAMQLPEEMKANLTRISTIDSPGFNAAFIAANQDDVNSIGDLTENYLAAGTEKVYQNAADYVQNSGSGNYIGSEHYIADTDEAEHQVSWMDWSVERNGDYKEEYTYHDTQNTNGGGSGGVAENAQEGADTVTDGAVSGGGGTEEHSEKDMDAASDESAASDIFDQTDNSSDSANGGAGNSTKDTPDDGQYESTESRSGGGGAATADQPVESSFHESGSTDASGEASKSASQGGGGSATTSAKTNEGNQQGNENGTSDSAPGGGTANGVGSTLNDSPAKGQSGNTGGGSGNQSAANEGSSPSGAGSVSHTKGGGSSGTSGGSGGGSQQIKFVSEAAKKCALEIAELAAKLLSLKADLVDVCERAGGVWDCNSSSSIRGNIKSATEQVMNTGSKTLNSTANMITGSEENYAKAESDNETNIANMFD